VDGELIVIDPNGRSDFSLLQHTLEQGRLEELQFCVFDLLYWKGEDLRKLRCRSARPDSMRRLPGCRRRGPCGWLTSSTATAAHSCPRMPISTSKA
jgi:bifunctional non-homologous end joining protein LigD